MKLNFERNKPPLVTMGLKWKKHVVIVFGILIVVSIIYFFGSISSGGLRRNVSDGSRLLQKSRHKQGYSVWQTFDPKPGMDREYFSKRCVKQTDFSITGLVTLRKEWADTRDLLCRELFQKFSAVFALEGEHASLKIPKPFQRKVRKWLGNDEALFQQVYNQDVIHVVNHYTHEHTIFNPIRDKRPVIPPEISEKKYVDDILAETSGSCDFCNFKEFTAEHTFGRVESRYAFSASNIFKMNPLHALVALKQHNPLDWNMEKFLDVMGLTLTWLTKANKHYPNALYPALIWDVLPKCGASQVHPHMQVMLDSHRYHGEVEVWRDGAQDYNDEFNSNYFSDLVTMYSVLNLTATYGDAVAFASLVPRKDHEVVIMAEKPSEDFYKLLYFVLRAFIDDLGKMCYSMGMGLPPFDTSKGRLPAYARVITRGAVTEIRTDISSFELFLASNVNIDPYKTIQFVRNSIDKRK
ncbi:uncharacterized protein LOC101853305 [Aplysia californica]|uniref:Uncharacterized protein LOC101853305 n=1 Tax=Aplysia californica TaxID=6500 RepID=A0ABM0JKC5_APLCA|nr:uncharacterized protein LOC101853305 [Aplysia californica]